MQVRLVVCTDYVGAQEDKASRRPAGPEQGHEIFQAKLEVLDLVASKRCSGESALAFLECENTLLDCVLDR